MGTSRGPGDSEERHRSGPDPRNPDRPVPAAPSKWLRSALDRDLRTALQKVLLRLDRLESRLGKEELDGEEARADLRRLREELSGTLDLIRDLAGLVGPVPPDDDGPRLREIVLRDLMLAAARAVEDERARREVRLHWRVDPDDLRMVAEQSWTLQAVEALLRAGLRAAVPDGAVRVRVGPLEGPAGESGRSPGAVVVEVHVRGADPATRADLEALRGTPPWSASVGPTGPAGLAAACGCCYAHLAGGELRVEEGEDDALRMVLELPRARPPERRDGWIP